MDLAVAEVLPPLLAYVADKDLLFRTMQGTRFNTKSRWSYYGDPIRKKVVSTV